MTQKLRLHDRNLSSYPHDTCESIRREANKAKHEEITVNENVQWQLENGGIIKSVLEMEREGERKWVEEVRRN
jgi:sucrose-6-phosphate hydrolase SacC (GH32 family)